MENVKEMVNNTVETTTNTINRIGREGFGKNVAVIGVVAAGSYLGFEYVLKPLGKKAKTGLDKLFKKEPKNKIEEAVEKAEEIVEEVVEEIEETLE